MNKRKKNRASSYEILTVAFGELTESDLQGDMIGLNELGENQFRGMASVFGMVVDAYMPTIMQRGAFTKTLQERSRDIPILWQHDMNEPIGKPVTLSETDRGLVLQAEISRTSRGRDVLQLLRDGVVRALSIGFEPVQYDMDNSDPENPIRYIREARLVEVSVVTLGADANALITEVRSAGQVAGMLERYGAEDVEEPTAEPAQEQPEGTESLGQQLDAFSAEYLTINPDATEETILTAFSATLRKAEPTTESLTLTDADQQLLQAELLWAELDLETL